MTDERLERFVRAAVRGIMEAILNVEEPPAVPVFSAPPYSPELVEPVIDEMPFPSVSRAQDELFGEPLPQSNADLDLTAEAFSRARKRQEQDARPEIQPGPGETEVTEWLRVPQV